MQENQNDEKCLFVPKGLPHAILETAYTATIDTEYVETEEARVGKLRSFFLGLKVLFIC